MALRFCLLSLERIFVLSFLMATVFVDSAPAVPPCGKSYLPVKGDTCTSVVKKAGITLAIFKILNPSVNCNVPLALKKFVCIKTGSKKVGVVDISILSSSAALKPRPVSSLLTWQPLWTVRQSEFSADVTSVSLRTCGAGYHVIADVSPQFFLAARMAGLAVLTDGRTFRYTQRNCWTEKDQKSFQPFVSVASCSFPLGAKLFVPELHGRKMPNKMVHNGCVRVDDTCEDADVSVIAQILGSGESLSADWKVVGARVHVREAPACVIEAYS